MRKSAVSIALMAAISFSSFAEANCDAPALLAQSTAWSLAELNARKNVSSERLAAALSGFEESTKLAAGFSATAYLAKSNGESVVVKIPFDDIRHDISARHEADGIDRVSKFDEEGLFVRGYYHTENGVFVSQFRSNLITFREWLKRTSHEQRLAHKNLIEIQLTKALTILRNAAIVHSDLHPDNILIEPETGRIHILDFGIWAEPGGYAPQMDFGTNGKIRGGYFPYHSPHQLANGAARFEDDAHSVQALLNDI